MKKNHVRALGVLSAVFLPALAVQGVETASWGDVKAQFNADGSPMAAAKKAPKVDVCHFDGDTGAFRVINVSGNALPAHIAHGDAQPGDAVPGDPTKEFDGACGQVDVGPPPTFTVFASREASGKTVTLSCEEGTISVIQALYGQNCVGAGTFTGSNDPDVTAHLAGACNGEETCVYSINHTVIGDPFFLCAKDYQAEWACE